MMHSLPVQPDDTNKIISSYISDRSNIKSKQDLVEHITKWNSLWKLEYDNHVITKDEIKLIEYTFDVNETYDCFCKIINTGNCEHDMSCCGLHVVLPLILIDARLISEEYMVPSDVALQQLLMT